MLKYLFCNQSPEYNFWGIKSAHSATYTEISQLRTENTNDSQLINFVVKCMPYGFAIDLMLHNFIASIFTVKNTNCSTEIAQGLLAVIAINTGVMTFTQCKLILNGFEKSRAEHLEHTTSDLPCTRIPDTTCLTQAQALAGILSSIESGVRWAYSVEIVVNPNISNHLLKNILVAAAGIGRGGAFFWSSGHAACDVPLGNTYTGTVLYAVLTSPLMPDLVKYVTIASPIAMSIIFSSAIIQTKNALKIEDPYLSASLYVVALFSGMLGFLAQKGYTCEVIHRNIKENHGCIAEWNRFWYGNAEHANIAQKSACAAKKFIDLLSMMPLAALDISDRLIAISCYFILAVSPIQLIALVQYISYPTLTYWMYYQVLHNTSDLLKTYTGYSTPEISAKIQFIATLVLAILLGGASGFTMLNVSGQHILKETNTVYSSGNISLPINTQFENEYFSAEPPPNNLASRFKNTVFYAKQSFSTCFGWFKNQFFGKTSLHNI